MPAKRPALKDYSVNFHLVADVAVRVSAATPEEAIAKGRDIEARAGELFDVDEVLDVPVAEVTGTWCLE